jgi:hypothetical protein
MHDWKSNTPSFVAELPVLAFPFSAPPGILAPERTVLKLADHSLGHTYLWCYLRRRIEGRSLTAFDPTSLSAARVHAMPEVLDRLAKWCRHDNAAPQSVLWRLKRLASFLSWADDPEHLGTYEHVLTDPDLALDALQGYHRHLRSRLQAHRLRHSTAGASDQAAIRILSELHGRAFRDAIEPLQERKGAGTQAPETADVAGFLSTMQAVFDSAARLVLGDSDATSPRLLRLSATDDALTFMLPPHYAESRLMEIACVAFAGLAVNDSGANLAQIRAYEEPEDLDEQLAQPDRINLTQRVIKLRAGGKEVPVHLTTITLSRLRIYLRIRSRLIDRLGCADIKPMFVQCAYGRPSGGLRTDQLPVVGVRPLDRDFLTDLRRKLRSVGAALPPVTLMQLRAYKQQHVVREHGLRVAAETMGHKVATAVAAYCKAQESGRRSEMAGFLESLSATVLDASAAPGGDVSTLDTPAGACRDYGKPEARDAQPLLVPDCHRTEGCFFCKKYCLHADERDLRKLLSCRYVLHRLWPMQGESARMDKVYQALLDRIDALVDAIRRRIPQVAERVCHDVGVTGNLTPYWAAKLQQLHLLGLLAPAA